MKVNRILSFTLSTLNIVCGKLGEGGALTSWLVKPVTILIGCISYSAASSAI
jgi:hypothetical protein